MNTTKKNKYGTYRVQKMINGTRYSLSFNHQPSETEITLALTEKILSNKGSSPYGKMTLKKGCEKYLEIKSLSPRYVREYKRLDNKFTKEFIETPMEDITKLMIDMEIAQWVKKKLAYATMKNYFGMMAAVVNEFTEHSFSTKMLPAKPKKIEYYIPTQEEVKKLLEYFRYNKPHFYALFWLSTYGLRRGEAFALTIDDFDFDEGIVTISKDIVEDENHNWVVKEPKTQDSKRKIGISKDLCDLIKAQGCIAYQGMHPQSLNKALKKAQVKLGIEPFSLHKMRHYCCTELLEAGCTKHDIMYYMGWSKGSDVYLQCYAHHRAKHNTEKQKALGKIITETYSN